MAVCAISGTVLDVEGPPVAGAAVRVRTVAPTLLQSGAGVDVDDVTTMTAADTRSTPIVMRVIGAERRRRRGRHTQDGMTVEHMKA